MTNISVSSGVTITGQLWISNAVLAMLVSQSHQNRATLQPFSSSLRGKELINLILNSAWADWQEFPSLILTTCNIAQDLDLWVAS